MTRAERVIAFIETYCRVPEGPQVGRPIRLLEFQRRFVRDVYDNPAGTRRAYLSVGRKNGKSALIACLLLAHLVGPEAKQNSQIISGARSREQAGIIFRLAEKIVRLSPALAKLIRVVPSRKTLIGLPMNVEYAAISAEAGTAHGLSPVVAILDEVGQVKGPHDAFVEAIETAQGAHGEDRLLLAISTQAPTDADLFSIWLDAPDNPHVVKHIYTAAEDCDLMDREAWAAANPAIGEFRSLEELAEFAQRAKEIPASENSFRWLYLNQRIEATTPFISRAVWNRCGGEVADFTGLPVFAGLDLSETADLTALVLIAPAGGKWHVRPTFWLPADGLRERAVKDRVPYDVWHREGHLLTAPGRSVDYEYVAEYLRGLTDRYDLRKVFFDRWNFRHLAPWLLKAGFTEAQVGGDGAMFEGFGQGFASMSPALRDLETDLLNERVVHGGHPVLTMCAANAVVQTDPAGNRKLAKNKSRGRIDGLVALTMARAAASTYQPEPERRYQVLIIG